MREIVSESEWDSKFQTRSLDTPFPLQVMTLKLTGICYRGIGASPDWSMCRFPQLVMFSSHTYEPRVTKLELPFGGFTIDVFGSTDASSTLYL